MKYLNEINYFYRNDQYFSSSLSLLESPCALVAHPKKNTSNCCVIVVVVYIRLYRMTQWFGSKIRYFVTRLLRHSVCMLFVLYASIFRVCDIHLAACLSIKLS